MMFVVILSLSKDESKSESWFDSVEPGQAPLSLTSNLGRPSHDIF